MKEKVSFDVTPYCGNENDVIRLFNKNRSEKKSRTYMDWRYKGEKSENPALIFWVLDSKKNRIGMTALIFRSYLVSGKPCIFGIGGDASINIEFRSRGIGKEFFIFIRKFMENVDYPCFALANEEAKNALISARWKIEDGIVSYVFILDASEKIAEKIKNKFVYKLFVNLFNRSLMMRLKLIHTRKIKYKEVKDFGKLHETFFKKVESNGFITRDRNMSTIRWRYIDHPQNEYVIEQAAIDNDIIGIIIYHFSGDKKIVINDFVVIKTAYVKSVMSGFIQDKKNKNNVLSSIRLVMNNKHPYAKILRRVGFFKRNEEGSLVVFSSEKTQNIDNHRWFITYGDKDI